MPASVGSRMGRGFAKRLRDARVLLLGLSISALATPLPMLVRASDTYRFLPPPSIETAQLSGGGLAADSVVVTEAQSGAVLADSARRYAPGTDGRPVIHAPAPPPPPPPPHPVWIPFNQRPVDPSVGVFIPYARAGGAATMPNSKAGWRNSLTLTFDDCGSADQMEAIVSALDAVQRKGMFFITGQCRDHYPWLVDALLGAGHQVCNHTYSHQNLTKLADAAIRAQIGGGVWAGCPYFRPPYGAWDGRVAQIAREYGLTMMLWDVDSRDWAGASAEGMAAMAAARGGVILFHLHGYATADAIRLLG